MGEKKVTLHELPSLWQLITDLRGLTLYFLTMVLKLLYKFVVFCLVFFFSVKTEKSISH